MLKGLWYDGMLWELNTRCNHTGVVPLKSDSGLMKSPPDEAETLNEQFKKSFTPKDEALPPPDVGESPYPDMTDIINDIEVHKLLTNLDVSI